MTNEELLKNVVVSAAKALGQDLGLGDIVIEHSRDTAHGDYSTNVAMRSCRLFGMKPRDLAEKLISEMKSDAIEKIEIAGPGFINFFLKKDALQSVIEKVLEQGDSYGRLPKNGKKIDIEYVSANPTGDLHLGHTRCAAVGDSIASLLDWAGYDVTREYYVNDCGNQVEHLGHSLRARYHELFGEPLDLAEDDYHGQDLIAIAQKIKDQFGDKYLQDSKESHDFFIRFGIDSELSKIWKDMDAFRVHFDKVSYESDIRSHGNIEKTIEFLKPWIYVQDGATYLRTTDFVDDKDRPIIKADGNYTYFMPDIAYHYNKMERGFDLLIDVLGADHHGYIGRMKSALMMKGYSPDVLQAEFVQVVRVYRDGAEVKMSKRTGKAIAHRDLVEDVGVDAVRYFFAERSQQSHLDFNYNLAMEQSSSNPVYYAQYAYARCASVLSLGSDIALNSRGGELKEESELALLRLLSDFPGVIASSAEERAPYKLAAYIQKLAASIHSFYTNCHILDRENIAMTSCRLALAKAAKTVMKNALSILGVSAPEKM
ncbi:MAG: arginine--tRNA ligase [Mollicutes bacterium]|nr:arginine--tRNA ligase [bacterium]MDD7064681.1 arginine--tRNA ligase [Mollicutes bacterium]MDY2687821.1 arginine--tRNA ligase [Candidatus Enteromonas sp.]MDY5298458.1 arginine--tRNA ligase [Candidatus Enteromonas sp.]